MAQQDAFATNIEDVGSVPLLKMHINLKDNIPVQKHYRPVPRHLYHEVKSHTSPIHEHRTFLPEWENSYFFVERNCKPFCLICQASLAHFKVSNIQRHFTSLHASMDQEFPKGTELRQHKLFTLKGQAEKQIQFFQKFTKQSEIPTLASYQLAWNIAKG